MKLMNWNWKNFMWWTVRELILYQYPIFQEQRADRLIQWMYQHLIGSGGVLITTLWRGTYSCLWEAELFMSTDEQHGKYGQKAVAILEKHAFLMHYFTPTNLYPTTQSTWCAFRCYALGSSGKLCQMQWLDLMITRWATLLVLGLFALCGAVNLERHFVTDHMDRARTRHYLLRWIEQACGGNKIRGVRLYFKQQRVGGKKGLLMKKKSYDDLHFKHCTIQNLWKRRSYFYKEKILWVKRARIREGF